MKVAVVGLGCAGTVTAAGLAANSHHATAPCVEAIEAAQPVLVAGMGHDCCPAHAGTLWGRSC